MGNPTQTPLVEAFHNAGFLVSEANGHISRDSIVLAAGALVLAGAPLGQVTTGATAAATALGTNTGNGTFGAITPVAQPTMIGVYGIAFTAATAFTVTAPDGSTATGTTGVPFSALGIGFTITAGGTPFIAGDSFTVTATQTVGNPTVVSAAGANTGNGTLGTLTAKGYAPVVGAYGVEFDDATHFVVATPDGAVVGHGTTGVAFAGGGLGFTITAGGTAFVPGDAFVITVAAGSGKWKAWTPGAADGSATIAGILFATKDATLADKPALAITRHAEVNASELVWPTGMSAAQIASGLAQLKALSIIPR
ncbi:MULTISPECIES: head decoration protein [unclassified Variovorax]|uniref:head decoration protein n=1 Tax=unclassified Variovorax TaxID=663243 RepID=UPI003F45DA18